LPLSPGSSVHVGPASNGADRLRERLDLLGRRRKTLRRVAVARARNHASNSEPNQQPRADGAGIGS